MRTVTACIDGSSYAEAVCDAAAWAALNLDAPLELVHVIDKSGAGPAPDVSGRIGLGTREHLLEELASLDEQRAKLAQQHGRLMLQAARERAEADGVATVTTCQRNGELVETLLERDADIRLLVLGRRGESAAAARDHLGSNLERVVRTLACPILITPDVFQRPKRMLIAFDGSPTAHKLVDRVAASRLAVGAECHLVRVTDTPGGELEKARVRLAETCGTVHTAVLSGEVEASLRTYKQEHDIDMLVMGAYGHSRIRRLLVGSTTTDMIRRARIPVLILR